MYRPVATTTALPPSLPPHNHFFHPPCCLLGFSDAADYCKSSMIAIIPSPMSMYIIFEMEDKDFEISSHPAGFGLGTIELTTPPSTSTRPE
ncbi:hypothetical protein ACFX13_047562 [Malus domestica]